MPNLFEHASKVHTGHPSTKPLRYYQKYDDFLSHHGLEPRTILEIGTFEGESTKIFSETFPEAKIVSLDLTIRPIDFSAYPNVIYEQADQTSRSQLVPIMQQVFPEGIDLVIEDAAHIGAFSKITFDIVFPFVRSGGAYFIEDWGTGYWNSWPDGKNYRKFSKLRVRKSSRRIRTHDFGMVGFVKSLVDLTHENAIKDKQSDPPWRENRLSVLEFGSGVCMLQKA